MRIRVPLRWTHLLTCSTNFIWRAAHSPWGSTSLASFSASELARSVLAGVTAKIRQLSREMNCIIISRIWCSISTGWSPTGTLVIPGRSIRVRFNTVERKRRLTCRLRAPRYQQCRTIWHFSANKTSWAYESCIWTTPTYVRSIKSTGHKMALRVFSVFKICCAMQMSVFTSFERHWFACLIVSSGSCHIQN